MQTGCENGIYPAVVHNTLQVDAAYNAAGTMNPPYVGKFFGPPAHDQPGKNSLFYFMFIKMQCIVNHKNTLVCCKYELDKVQWIDIFMPK